MNKTVPFVYHGFGSHTLIKLNMNLTPEDAAEIRKEYDFNVMYCNSRKNPHLYRIEGVVSWNTRSSEKYIMWFEKLKLYQVNSIKKKRKTMMNKKKYNKLRKTLKRWKILKR
jgi:hypothetical protein